MLHLTDEDLRNLLDKPMFHRISETADELGLECYVVGGYVRDLFLERPSKDIDCVVVDPQIASQNQPADPNALGPGIRLAKALGKKLGNKANVSIFKNFGTAQVKWHGEEVEFVGARRESYSRNSRKPIVEDGTLEDDLDRRDFTINALAIQLNKDKFGCLVDRFDGLWDMEDGLIATPLDPDITFSDDPLRMMRCIRFATQLNFRIEDETQQALERNAERISIISQERIIDELNKIILSPIPSIGFIELERCGLLPIILPEIAALCGKESRGGRSHKDNFYHTLEVLDNVCKRSDNLWLRWAALLHDTGKIPTFTRDETGRGHFYGHASAGAEMADRVLQRLGAPDSLRQQAALLIERHMKRLIPDEQLLRNQADCLGWETLKNLLALQEADMDSKGTGDREELDVFQRVRLLLNELRREEETCT